MTDKELGETIVMIAIAILIASILGTCINTDRIADTLERVYPEKTNK